MLKSVKESNRGVIFALNIVGMRGGIMKKKKTIDMKKLKKVIKEVSADLIKVQLDHRTIIYVKNKHVLQSWLSRYPNARIL